MTDHRAISFEGTITTKSLAHDNVLYSDLFLVDQKSQQYLDGTSRILPLEHLRLPNLITGVFFAVSSIFVICTIIYTLKFETEIIYYGARTNAVIIGRRYEPAHGRESSLYVLTFRYQAGFALDCYQGEASVSNEIYSKTNIGDRIVAHYSVIDPYQTYLEGAIIESRRNLGGTILLLGMSLLWILLYLPENLKNRVLSLNGRLVDAIITDVYTSTWENGRFFLAITYEFVSPNLKTSIEETEINILGKKPIGIPSAGQYVKVIYLSEKHFRLL